MTEQISRSRIGAAEHLPRCCPRHDDWPTLAQHLLDEFPEASISAIVREVAVAKDAVAQLGLDDQEALETGELIVRYQLLMSTGRKPDVARLDPEKPRMSRGQAIDSTDSTGTHIG